MENSTESLKSLNDDYRVTFHDPLYYKYSVKITTPMFQYIYLSNESRIKLYEKWISWQLGSILSHSKLNINFPTSVSHIREIITAIHYVTEIEKCF